MPPARFVRLLDPLTETVDRHVFKLHCQCNIYGRRGWCNHLKEGLRDRVDAEPVDGEHLYRHDYATLEVPIYGELKWSVRLRLGMAEGSAGFRPVEVRVHSDNDHWETIGYVEPLAVRRELRSAFIEWLLGEWELQRSEMHCDSGWHVGGSAPHEAPSKIHPSRLELQDFWYLITQHICVVCATSGDIPDIA